MTITPPPFSPRFLLLFRHGRLAAPPAPALDFWAALLAFLNGDAPCAAAFPGGFVQGVPGGQQVFPYCGLDQSDARTQESHEDDTKRAGFRAYAHDDDACAASAAVLIGRILDSPSRSPIVFSVAGDSRPWVEAGCQLVGPPTMPKFIGYARDGLEVWRSEFGVRFYVTVER